MNLDRVCFIGHGKTAYASVESHCRDIAPRLECTQLLGIESIAQVPRHYDIFVCTKPQLSHADMMELAGRGKVVWHILDEEPPHEGIHTYIANTRIVQQKYAHLGNVQYIPERHVNVNRIIPPLKTSPAACLCVSKWNPELPRVEWWDTKNLNTTQVAALYLRAGIVVNLRKPSPEADYHAAMNPGAKLINCMAFGLPSISSDEPAYRELGPDCTIYATPETFADTLANLQASDTLIQNLRHNCLERAEQFHPHRVCQQYLALLEELL